MENIKKAIRDIPDFPKPGIIFKDITPVLSDPSLFRQVVAAMTEELRDRKIDKIAVIESRGFLFGTPVAEALGIGIVPVRKKGKLPYRTVEQSYELEYGTAVIEIHEDAIEKGERVAVIDDLLATGGTAEATAQLIEKIGGEVAEFLFLVELSFLNGRERLSRYPIYAPVVY